MDRHFENLKKIGENIRKHRTSQKIKQEYPAKKVGLSKSFISRIENGQRDSGIVTLFEIASILGIKTSSLLED